MAEESVKISRPGRPIPVPPDFPVRWERAGDAALHWELLNRNQVPPMAAAITRLEFAAYARGFSQSGQPAPAIRLLQVNGYLYLHKTKTDPVGSRAEAPPAGALARAAAQPLAFWREEMLPELQGALARLEALDLPAAAWPELQAGLKGALALDQRVEELLQPIMAMQAAYRAFKVWHEELFGPGLPHKPLLQGLDSVLTRMNRELDQLCRMALETPEVQAALRDPDSGRMQAVLEKSPAGQAFGRELTAFLLRHGRRLSSRDLTAPTWQEDPTPILQVLREAMDNPSSVPGAELHAMAARRAEAEAAVQGRLELHSRSVRERYAEGLHLAREVAVVVEEHNYWMHRRCRTPIREVLLECGRRLAAGGQLAQAEHVWWLTPEELLPDGPPAPGWRDMVAARQAEWGRYAAVTPPMELGSRPAETA